MGQLEGLSDCVMATSVSVGQMVFPGVSELMALQPERASKWSTLSTRNIKAAWPGAQGLEQLLCPQLELMPCPHWLASHLLPETSLQVAALVAGRGYGSLPGGVTKSGLGTLASSLTLQASVSSSVKRRQ